MPDAPSSKEKGDLLESVIADLCSNLSAIRVTRNAKLAGRQSGTIRDIDVLIEGKLHVFDVKIAIEAKNYNRPVGLEKIESLQSKLQDIAVDLGVMICPSGFTESAITFASAVGIQLYEIWHPRLGNDTLLVPVGLVHPYISRFKIGLEHRAPTAFGIDIDYSQWRVHVGDKILAMQELLTTIWKDGRIPQRRGVHRVEFGAVILSDIKSPDVVQYCEITLTVDVLEKYYLKLFPAALLKRTTTGEQQIDLQLDIHASHDDMTRGGWHQYDEFAQMIAAAKLCQGPNFKGIVVIRSETAYDDRL